MFSSETRVYTVMDLKDVFFSIPLVPQSQPLFAFEWTDLETGFNGQLTWTRLPQGFKNSPSLFDEALHADLGEYCLSFPRLHFCNMWVTWGLQHERNKLQRIYRGTSKNSTDTGMLCVCKEGITLHLESWRPGV